MIAEPRIVSLRDMLNINARPFIGAATELRDVLRIAERIEDQTVTPGDDDHAIIKKHLDVLKDALLAINARLALKSVSRLEAHLDAVPRVIQYRGIINLLREIEGRFADQLDDVALFVCSSEEFRYFGPADELIGSDGFTVCYPTASLEIEEAAKSIVFGRHTASVFHCMRALEKGIRALSSSLGIEDPVKPADRNWAKMLNAIRIKIDADYPTSSRLPNTKGAELDSLYANLDAVRIPWRNATMHVENVYLPHEASHIFRCTGFFMSRLALHCDEEGYPSPEGDSLFEDVA